MSKDKDNTKKCYIFVIIGIILLIVGFCGESADWLKDGEKDRFYLWFFIIFFGVALSVWAFFHELHGHRSVDDKIINKINLDLEKIENLISVIDQRVKNSSLFSEKGVGKLNDAYSIPFSDMVEATVHIQDDDRHPAKDFLPSVLDFSETTFKKLKNKIIPMSQPSRIQLIIKELDKMKDKESKEAYAVGYLDLAKCWGGKDDDKYKRSGEDYLKANTNFIKNGGKVFRIYIVSNYDNFEDLENWQKEQRKSLGEKCELKFVTSKRISEEYPHKTNMKSFFVLGNKFCSSDAIVKGIDDKYIGAFCYDEELCNECISLFRRWEKIAKPWDELRSDIKEIAQTK